MPIYAACPSCGARYPLEAAIADTEARRALAAAVRGLPQEVLRRLVGYLDCHSPPGRAMAWGKAARVIEELIALVEPGTVQRGQGVPRAAPGWLWAIAMDEVASMREEGDLSLPLKGHGLLEEICYRLAGKAEGRAEAQAQASARGETPVGYHPSHRIVGETRPERGQDAPAPGRSGASPRWGDESGRGGDESGRGGPPTHGGGARQTATGGKTLSFRELVARAAAKTAASVGAPPRRDPAAGQQEEAP